MAEPRYMDAAIIVGILGAVTTAVVGLSTYFLGKRHGMRIREADKREQRINRFVDDYVDRARRNINTGISALVPCGVSRLNDDGEIREALDMCRRQLGKHPLGSAQEELASQDLKRFFDFAADRRINFATTSVAQALEMIRREQG